MIRKAVSKKPSNIKKIINILSDMQFKSKLKTNRHTLNAFNKEGTHSESKGGY